MQSRQLLTSHEPDLSLVHLRGWFTVTLCPSATNVSQRGIDPIVDNPDQIHVGNSVSVLVTSSDVLVASLGGTNKGRRLAEARGDPRVPVACALSPTRAVR